MKTILLIAMLILLPGVSSADNKERKDKIERKEKKEMRREANVQRKKMDNRSRQQKRKDRHVLCLIVLAGALVFSGMQE